jgi:hypothetical protein
MPGRRPPADTRFVLLLFALIALLSACQSVSSKASSTTTNTTATASTASDTTTTSFAVVQVVQRSAQSDQVPVGKSGTVTATCQSGEQLLSGGYYVYAWEAAANVVASYPSAQDSWTVTDDNTSGPSYVSITAYANCLQAPYSVGLRLVSSTSQSSSTSQATTVDCPSGTVRTGGGFQAAGGIAASTPTAHGWSITPGVVGKVFALCATERLRAAPATSATFTTKMVFGSPQSGSAHCQEGQIVTGGGYSFEQGETFIAVNALALDASSWDIGAAGGYNAVSVVVWAACVIAPQA